MERKYWAKRRTKQVGPYKTRDEALKAFRETFPHKGPDYMAASRQNKVLTGYGEFGAYGDIRWHDAKDLGND